MLHQHFEQREFTAGHGDIFAVFAECARAEIQFERTELDDFGFGGGCAGRACHRTAAQHGLYARHQFARVERFGQVIVCAHFKADDAIDLVALGGEHDDGDVVIGATQALADGEAVLARQHQVKDQQIVTLARKVTVHVGGVRHGTHRKALFGEIFIQ